MTLPTIELSGVSPYVVASVLGALLTVALLLVKRFLWSQFLHWTRLSDRPLDEVQLNRLLAPMNAILILISLSFALQLTPSEVRSHPAVATGTKTLFILALLWFVNRALTLSLQFWKPMKAMGESTRMLVLTLGRVALVALTGLVVLDTIGISITPFLASLGVGSVAVALALQDTLNNFFCGIYVLLDEPIRVGDFVRFDGNMEGTVRRIGWRSTHIQSGSNMIVVPNSKISSSVLTNFNFPDESVEIVVPVGASYTCDLERVERVAVEVGKAVLKKTAGAVTDFEPFVRFKAFSESRVDFTVILRAKSQLEQAFVTHHFIKALQARFEAEKISIPFPQRVVHYPQKPAPPNA